MTDLTPAERRKLEDAAEGDDKAARVIQAFLESDEEGA